MYDRDVIDWRNIEHSKRGEIFRFIIGTARILLRRPSHRSVPPIKIKKYDFYLLKKKIKNGRNVGVYSSPPTFLSLCWSLHSICVAHLFPFNARATHPPFYNGNNDVVQSNRNAFISWNWDVVGLASPTGISEALVEGNVTKRKSLAFHVVATVNSKRRSQ